MASFKAALPEVFNSALKLLGMAYSQEHYIEVTQLKKCQDINRYYKNISREYLLCGTERMHNLVVEVKLCTKATSDLAHEYISARVRPTDGAQRRAPFYVIFEHFRGEKLLKSTDPTDWGPDSESTATLPPSLPRLSTVPESAASVSDMLSNDSSTVLDGSSGRLQSSSLMDDRVTLVSNAHDGRYSGNDAVYRTLTFSNDSPFYSYKLCYFYAGSIVKVLQDVCSNVSAVKGDGKCMKIPIYAGNRLEIEKLISIYEEAKATLEKTVSDIEQTKLKKDKTIDNLTQARVVNRNRIAELEHLLNLATQSGTTSLST